MAKNFVLDSENVIEGYVRRIMKEYEELRILKALNWLYTWKLGDPEYDNEKLMIQACTRKLPARERDIYGKDVELRIHLDTWHDMVREQRKRLVHHELLHVVVEQDEDMEIMHDDDERVSFRIIPHDIVIKTFQREVEIYGLASGYKPAVKRLANGITK